MSENIIDALKTFGLDNLDEQNLESLKIAYHRLALSSHPDRGGSAKEFIKIRESYSALKRYLTSPESYSTDNESIDYKSAYNQMKDAVKRYEAIFNSQVISISSTTKTVNQYIDKYNQEKEDLNNWLKQNQDGLKNQYDKPLWKQFLPGKDMNFEEYSYHRNELITLYNEQGKEIDDKFIQLIVEGYKNGFSEVVELLNNY